MEFKSIFDFIRTVPDEVSCIQYLEEIRWAGNVVSPYDETSKVYKCANNKYKCKNTGLYFNVCTGTIFEASKIPLTKWFMALYIFASHKRGISSYQLAKDIDVTQKSAWFLLHRLRYLFNHPDFQVKLEGIIEADTTYIGGKTANKHKSKRDEDNAKGTGTVNKTPVFGMVQRGGNLVIGKIKAEDQETIRPIIRNWIEVQSTLISDGHDAYTGIKGIKHESVSHSQGEYARDFISTGNIDGFWSQFKRGIVGIYYHISSKHVNRYAHEFSLRYNTRLMRTNSRFDLILTNMENRLTYKTLIAK